MHCQTACPVNKKKRSWVEKGESFNEAETELILQRADLEGIPEETRRKLERMDIIEYFDRLGRNLGVLLE
jgi:epoxyqueuosine reductase